MSNPNAVPPVAHQFKPGQSGNPKGNTDGHSTRSIPEWINKLLKDPEFEITTIEKGEYKSYKAAPLEAIIKAQINLALNSKDEAIRIKATDLLMKHGAPAKVLLGSDPENPLPTNPVDANLLTQFLQSVELNTKR